MTADEPWKSEPYPVEALQKRLQQSRDAEERKRIQRLIDAESDLLAIEHFVGTLKTQEAGDILSNASLLFLVKHVYIVRSEFKHPQK